MIHPIQSPDGTPVSRFAFGCMQFGGGADAGPSQAMFEAAIAAGITHFDTAHVYTDGMSETLLGRFAAPLREKLVIATKAGYAGGAARGNILSTFDDSRRRLGMDRVDILYMHRWDDATPLEETFDTLAELHGQGLIGHVGVSNYAAWQVMKAQAVAAARGLSIAILQPMYNLVKRQAEVEILPMCAAEGIAVAPYSPLGGGLLSGKYARGETGRLDHDTRYAERYAPGWMGRAAGALAEIAVREGVHPATLAVAWVARHPAGPMPIVSARTPEQLAPSLAALDYDMSDALYAELCALSPAPPPATDRLEEA